jgi:hypothetical protein
MRHRSLGSALVILAIAAFAPVLPDAAQGDVVWFRFKKSFINSRYPTDVAFGSIQVGSLWKVGPSHTITGPACSGTDGDIVCGR